MVKEAQSKVSRLHDDNRPVQPLGDRELQLVSAE
jgi:hypothetical protein